MVALSSSSARLSPVQHCSTRRRLITASSAAAASKSTSGVSCISPSSSLQDTEAAIKTIGQAYVMHRWNRDLQGRLGKEQDLFEGLARLHLDTFSDAHILLLSDCCNAAAILISSSQESELVSQLQSLSLSVIPGTLQIMQAIPEGRLPKLTSQLEQLQQDGVRAARAAGHDSFLKLVCMAVRPEFQGRGLGRSLLAAAVARAKKEQQVLCADLADDDLVPFFKSHGFQVIGRSGNFVQMAT